MLIMGAILFLEEVAALFWIPQLERLAGLLAVAALVEKGVVVLMQEVVAPLVS